ncbi:hypothetical protein PFISCL1PPCAC_14770, partial [Pristionchus fissidentatus]
TTLKMVQHGNVKLSEVAIGRLNKKLEPLRAILEVHPLYKAVESIEDLQIFMQNHVYAVWDFMSLLKGLQVNLTCVDIPWIPRGSRIARRLINEIVLGEESDQVGGRFISHLELYIESMEHMGADTTGLEGFLQSMANLKNDYSEKNIKNALEANDVSPPAQAFVRKTFSFLQTGQIEVIAAAFAFGREDLIPLMFTGLLKDMNKGLGGILDTFIVYLERHIEVDGEEHGPMSLQMMTEICGDDNDPRWELAIETAYQALEARVKLWDGVVELIEKDRKKRGTK